MGDLENEFPGEGPQAFDRQTEDFTEIEEVDLAHTLEAGLEDLFILMGLIGHPVDVFIVINALRDAGFILVVLDVEINREEKLCPHVHFPKPCVQFPNYVAKFIVVLAA